MRLNEICEVYSGYALKSFNDSEVGLPVVKIGNILTDGTLNLDECQYTTDCVNEKYYSNKDDIYIALSGATIGKIGIMDADERYVVNQRVGIVRKKSDDVPQEYIKYFLLKQTNRILQEAAGCAQPNISPKQIAEYSVPEVSKEKMFEVCIVLDAIKRIIDMRKAELIALDNLIKARFVETFGDLANPKCIWKKCKLIEACADKDDIKCGPFGTQLSKDEYTDTGVAVWEIPQINSAFVMKPVHFLTEEKAEELNAYTIISGDIAMSRKGNVGKCAVFPDDYPDGIIHSDVLRIRVDNKKVNSIFMMCQLHYSREVTRQIEMVSSGAIMAGINVTKLKQIYVHFPPMELQDEFANFVHQVDKSKFVKLKRAFYRQ